MMEYIPMHMRVALPTGDLLLPRAGSISHA